MDKLVTVNRVDPINSKIRRKRTGREVYRNRYFVVVEFTGAAGRFREAFWPEQIVQIKEDKTMEIGRITTIAISCKDCNKVFAMLRREILWYSNMGYPLPKRCPECRKKRKEMKESEKKANAAAGNAK